MIGVAILGGCALAAAFLFGVTYDLGWALASGLLVLTLLGAVVVAAFQALSDSRRRKPFLVVFACLLLLPVAAWGGDVGRGVLLRLRLPRYKEAVQEAETQLGSLSGPVPVNLKPEEGALGYGVRAGRSGGALVVVFVTGGAFAGHQGVAYREGGWPPGVGVPFLPHSVSGREVAPEWVAWRVAH